MGYCEIADVRAEVTTDKTDPQIQAIIDEKSAFIDKVCNTTFLTAVLPIKRACVMMVCREIDPDYKAEITDERIGDFAITKKIPELTPADAITGIPYVDCVLKLYKEVNVEFRGI